MCVLGVCWVCGVCAAVEGARAAWSVAQSIFDGRAKFMVKNI